LPQQVLDSLFHVVLGLDQVRPPVLGEPVSRSAIDGASVRPDSAVIARVTSAVARYLDVHWVDVCGLFPSAQRVQRAPWGLRVGTDEWPHLLADAVAGVARGRFESARDHLVALYVNRVLTFWEEIEGLDGDRIDALLDRQAADTVHAVRSKKITFAGSTAPAGFHENHWVGFNDASTGLGVPA